MSVSTILGFKRPLKDEGVLLHGLQSVVPNKNSVFIIVGQLLAAVATVWVFLPHIFPLWLVLWAFALMGIQVFAAIQFRKFSEMDSGRVPSQSAWEQVKLPLAAALCWAVALIAFGPTGTPFDQVALWVIVGAMGAGLTLFIGFSPIGVIAFIALSGLAATLSIALEGHFVLAALIPVFSCTLGFGVIEVARAHVNAHIARQSIIEKDEVVSLLLREFEENEADWLWQVDTSRRVRSISPRFAYALGCAQEEAEGKPLFDLIAGPSSQPNCFDASLHEFAEFLKSREAFGTVNVAVQIKGKKRWWALSGTPMHDERGNFLGFRGVGSDITEQRESSEKIAYLARYDTLTSLPNRMQVNEALGEALRFAEQWRTRCAFLMVDLDRFKSVNDSLGHLVGDKLLAQVSSRLQDIVGEGQMCGRLGGDEFAIVIRDASDRNVVADVAHKVIDTLSEPYKVDNHTLYVGASVGSAIGPRDGRTVEELMRNADLALYRSKDEGGGEHFRFEPVLHASANERRQLEAALREALDRQELQLNFQPVVDAKDEQIVSFEALVRWSSKEHGPVSPGKFVPLAEETRLIVPIGQWVLREACKEARNWPDHIKVNVNVSPEQLLEPDFTDEVVSALADSGLRPERLEVEVTESIFLRDASIARAALEQVMAIGCSVALDDFGTGYSSLGYLRKLRFSTIKVDRTFVQGAAQNSAESLAIIRAVVAMAQSLDMSTTAEGVETADEAELLRELGCDKIQGFYFGRPMSSLDARKLFALQDMRQRA